MLSLLLPEVLSELTYSSSLEQVDWMEMSLGDGVGIVSMV